MGPGFMAKVVVAFAFAVAATVSLAAVVDPGDFANGTVLNMHIQT